MPIHISISQLNPDSAIYKPDPDPIQGLGPDPYLIINIYIIQLPFLEKFGHNLRTRVYTTNLF